MWVSYIPDDRFWRLLPVVMLAALCLWGLISPRSQWPLLWGWGRANRHVTDPDERARLVRGRLVVPLVMSIILGIVLWPQR